MFKEKIKKIIGLEKTKRIVNFKYKFYNAICNLFPMKKEIMLESIPDYSCNSYQLYRYMIDMGLNKIYRITWLVDDISNCRTHEKNVGCLCMYPKNAIDKIIFYIRCNRARIFITSNRYISRLKLSSKQLYIYLDHGSQLKNVLLPNGEKCYMEFDYLICQSHFFIPYNLSQYRVSNEQIICTGLPRNDQLFFKHDSIKSLIPEKSKYKKIITWVPTFRQHKNKIRLDCKFNYPLGLPILNSKGDAIALNDELKENNVLLIIKPHPNQDMDVIKALDLSNIMLLNLNDLIENNIQTNEFLEQTDAMITDYSSIYYDYLLLHRPIGITLDDYESYLNDKGFVFENPLDILKGFYIYNVNDFCKFIRDTASGFDVEKESREKIFNLVHEYDDANSSKRVFDFIMKKANERFNK